jgi:hypothetical protein
MRRVLQRFQLPCTGDNTEIERKQLSLASKLLCEWFNSSRMDALLAFCEQHSIQALRDCPRDIASSADEFGPTGQDYILPIIEAFIHVITQLQPEPPNDFIEFLLFKSVLRQEDLAWIHSVIYSAPLSSQNLESRDEVQLIIRRYHPEWDTHQWPLQVMEPAKQNIEKLYSRTGTSEGIPQQGQISKDLSYSARP